MDTESPETWIEREKMEQELISKGGVLPHPWRVDDTSSEDVLIKASNEELVAVISRQYKHVANWIKEQFNKNPVAFLEDDIYYY